MNCASCLTLHTKFLNTYLTRDQGCCESQRRRRCNAPRQHQRTESAGRQHSPHQCATSGMNGTTSMKATIHQLTPPTSLQCMMPMKPKKHQHSVNTTNHACIICLPSLPLSLCVCIIFLSVCCLSLCVCVVSLCSSLSLSVRAVSLSLSVSLCVLSLSVCCVVC